MYSSRKIHIYRFKGLIVGFICLVAFQHLNAQNRYKITESTVSFFAGTPLEDIDGKSEKLIGVIDADSKVFAFRIPMNTFIFPRSLMQEHYNENYLETEKYPFSEFKGSIQGEVNWQEVGSYEVTAEGTFEVHGVPKEYQIPATIDITEKGMQLKAQFTIVLEDHNIKRPKIVLMKIAEQATVTVSSSLVKI